MNLNNLNLEKLLLAAIKSEIESRKLYLDIAKKTKNGLLSDKLKFIANEEKKHKKFIENIYKNHYPGKKIIIPKKSPVPLPQIIISDEMAVSKLLKMAMEAETAASDFYKSLSKFFEKGSKLYNTLVYFSDMENGHFKILETEKESMERFEEADVYWPMVHAGP
ncbi:MAG: ferritin family protein [Candidatus Thermoplasmatota archaeon]|jgi:rubrerythrin|nr:ferritin family protein [Candidatus Thermoplasmatota archaeon]